jgi:nicotinate-nucleotide adenylyltransferase
MPKAPIGILGGVFDPVHNGHIAVAQLALDYFGLDTVYFVPTGRPPHKGSVIASPADRFAMLQAAVKGRQGLKICDGEVQRKGVSFTIDTILTFKKWAPGREIFFLIGSDNLTEITSWRRYREILDNVVLCVAHRPGHSARVPAALQGARVRRFSSPEWGISSTMVRSYLASGLRCCALVPDGVLGYIRQHGLYRRSVRATSAIERAPGHAAYAHHRRRV